MQWLSLVLVSEWVGAFTLMVSGISVGASVVGVVVVKFAVSFSLRP